MLREFRTAQGQTILGMPCLSHRDDPEDTVLAGEHGAIYQCGQDSYRVIISNHQKANRWIPGNNAAPGDETGILVDETTARGWLKKLEVPANTALQSVLFEKQFK